MITLEVDETGRIVKMGGSASFVLKEVADCSDMRCAGHPPSPEAPFVLVPRPLSNSPEPAPSVELELHPQLD